MRQSRAATALLISALATVAPAEDCNLRVVTDASPDYTDLPSLVRSVTHAWPTPKEQCWAMFYWNHIARRQTEPTMLHGLELTDPIRQFNDYGYAMCSTISGINQAIWEQMGLRHKFWDIHVHTVAEVEYDGAFHCYDNSLSALYTRCDGTTIAGVEEIGADGACALSGGKSEPGHIARYHCLTGTGPNGLLTGGDCNRTLESEGCHVFRAPGLAYRNYFYSWEYGHRYQLNLRDHEVYTRSYRRLDKQGDGDETKETYKHTSDPAYFIPNPDRDPESVNPRYRIRGNGTWTFTPALDPAGWAKDIHRASGIAASPAGLHPEQAGTPGEVVYRVQSANVTTSQKIAATFTRTTDGDEIAIAVSGDNGTTWKPVWKAEGTGEVKADLKLIAEVSGSYDSLIRITLNAKAAAADVALTRLAIETITEINSKAQPKLDLGRNTVWVGTGAPTESIVYWPDLRGDRWKALAVDSKNLHTDAEHPGWHAVMRQEGPGEAYIVYKMDAPRDIVRLEYGARMYNYDIGNGPHIDYRHSFDGGKTWITSFTQTKVGPPYDVIHHQVVDEIPAGTRSVLFKFVIDGGTPNEQGWGFYGLRMEADYRPADEAFAPLEVTFAWKEVQKDRSTVARSHTQLIEKVPSSYTIDVGGEDVPIIESLRTNLKGAVPGVRYGYSDGKDVGGDKWLYRWRTEGANLAQGKPYVCSVPPNKGADPGGRLTDGAVGPPNAGGPEFGAFGVGWDNASPAITVDLGKEERCGAFRIHLSAGWPWWDAFAGEVQDTVEVLTSVDGNEFTSRGRIDTALRRKDVPINYMVNDDETATGWNFQLLAPEPVSARYVRFQVEAKRWLSISEVQVFDEVKETPFDIRISLPDAP